MCLLCTPFSHLPFWVSCAIRTWASIRYMYTYQCICANPSFTVKGFSIAGILGPTAIFFRCCKQNIKERYARMYTVALCVSAWLSDFMIPSHVLTCCVSSSSNLTYIPFLEFALKKLLSWFTLTLVGRELLRHSTLQRDTSWNSSPPYQSCQPVTRASGNQAALIQ